MDAAALVTGWMTHRRRTRLLTAAQPDAIPALGEGQTRYVKADCMWFKSASNLTCGCGLKDNQLYGLLERLLHEPIHSVTDL